MLQVTTTTTTVAPQVRIILVKPVFIHQLTSLEFQVPPKLWGQDGQDYLIIQILMYFNLGHGSHDSTLYVSCFWSSSWDMAHMALGHFQPGRLDWCARAICDLTAPRPESTVRAESDSLPVVRRYVRPKSRQALLSRLGAKDSGFFNQIATQKKDRRVKKGVETNEDFLSPFETKLASFGIFLSLVLELQSPGGTPR